MNIHEALETAQDTAHVMLVEQFDAEREIPMRAASHTDLWPGDRWPEAYIAADETELAQAAMTSIERSFRPDSAFPHIMQGSHIRGGIETRWIDRQVYRMQGNGATRLSNGEWVTNSLAPPTQALSTLAMYEAGLREPLATDAGRLIQSALSLYMQRGNEEGLIATSKRDELTSSTSEYATRLKRDGTVVDPAINALMVGNNQAIDAYAAVSGINVAHEQEYDELSGVTEEALRKLLLEGPHTAVTSEEVLALARLGMYRHHLTDDRLAKFFQAPDLSSNHPERSHLNLAMTIEVARLTASQSEASHDYLGRILNQVAELGAAAMTEYEGSMPKGNAVMDKYERKHLWLPTAAEIVQIDSSSL